MHSDVPLPAPVRPVPSALARLLHSSLWIAFTVVVAGLFALTIASAFLGAGLIPVLTALAVGVLGFLGLRALPRGGWIRLMVAYGSLATVIGYLVRDDDAILRPLSFEEISPRFAGDEASFEVLMRYGKNHPLGQQFRLPTSQQLYQGPGAWRPSDPQWSTWLARNRTELEANWTKLEPVRAWWTELNSFERIGDLTPPQMDAEILTFAPVRTFSQHTCAIASLQALDGRGDEAIQTLLPLLEVSRKLEPSSRTLVRSMMARVAQKLALETASFVIARSDVSPATRTRLASALSGGFGGAEGARRLVLMEYVWGNVSLHPATLRREYPMAEKSAGLRRCLLPLGPVAFNSRRTLNLYGELMGELERCAADRAASEIDEVHRKFFEGQGRMRFKNLVGSLALSWVTPAYKKIVESYWTTEDLRAALLRRL